jgi:hypothetical protein
MVADSFYADEKNAGDQCKGSGCAAIVHTFPESSDSPVVELERLCMIGVDCKFDILVD